MKIYATMAIAAGAFLTVCAGQAANAATTIDTDFNATATSVTPNTVDIASATSIGFFLLPISNIVTDNTGIILFGTLPVLTNPAPIGGGQSLTLSWTTPEGEFTDALTEMTVVGVPNTSLTIIATGDISGPAGFDPAASQVTFLFRQGAAGGYSMSGMVTTDVTAAIPEPSTWALALAGFAGLAAVGWRRGGRARSPAC
jgi:PEP-CTERM motif